MRQPQRRHLGKTEEFCRFDPPMSGDELIVIINQNGIAESKPRDAFRDFLDLLARVGPGVCFVRYKLVHLNDFNFVADGVKRVSLLPSTNGCDKARRTRAASPTLFNSNFHFPSLLDLVGGTIPTSLRQFLLKKRRTCVTPN